MNIIAVAKDAWAALAKGKELANAETWKNQSIVVNSIAGTIVAVVALGCDLGVGVACTVAVQADALGLAVGGLAWVLYNVYITVATTTRIGLPTKPNDPPSDQPGNQGSGDGFSITDMQG